MPRNPDAVRCTARHKDGSPCEAWAIRGGRVCGAHGGRAAQVRAKAAEREAARKATDMAVRRGWERVTDPLGKLLDAAGEMEAMKDALAGAAAQLREDEWRYRGPRGEETRAELSLYLQYLRDFTDILTKINRLGVDERLYRVSAAQAEQVVGAVQRAVESLALPAEDTERVLAAVARELAGTDSRQLEPA